MRRINFLLGCLLLCLFVLPTTAWAQGEATCYPFTGSGAAGVFDITVQIGQGSTKSFTVTNIPFGLGLTETRDDGAFLVNSLGQWEFTDGSSFYFITDSIFKQTDAPGVFSVARTMRIVGGTGALSGVFDGRMVFPGATTTVSGGVSTIPVLRGAICIRAPTRGDPSRNSSYLQWAAHPVGGP